MNDRDFRLVTSNPNIHAQKKYIVGCLPKKKLISNFFFFQSQLNVKKIKADIAIH